MPNDPKHPDMGSCSEAGECHFVRGLPGQWFCIGEGRNCGVSVVNDGSPLYKQIDRYYRHMERMEEQHAKRKQTE
jgi:hypothetical protein